MDQTEQKVVEIIKKYTFNQDVWADYNSSKRIIADLKINSARIVDIILDIEEHFGIEISDDAIEKLVTVNDALELIKNSKQ